MHQECLMHQHFLLVAVFLFSPVFFENMLKYTPVLQVFNEAKLGILSANWLKSWDSYRRTDWINEIEYPEFTTKKVDRFLQYK